MLTGINNHTGRGRLVQISLGTGIVVLHIDQGVVDVYFSHIDYPRVVLYAVPSFQAFEVLCDTVPRMNGGSIQCNTTWANLFDTRLSWRRLRRTMLGVDRGYGYAGAFPGYFRLTYWHDYAMAGPDDPRFGPFPSATLLQLSAPFWFPTLISLALALWAAWPMIRSMRERRRLARGLCLKCGYDLRATPDRCPECGWTRSGEVRK